MTAVRTIQWLWIILCGALFLVGAAQLTYGVVVFW